MEPPGRPGARPPEPGRSAGRRPGPRGPSLNPLVEVGEEVDSERVLLVQLVAIGALHGVRGVGRGRVLQEDVPVAGGAVHASVHLDRGPG